MLLLHGSSWHVNIPTEVINKTFHYTIQNDFAQCSIVLCYCQNNRTVAENVQK